MVPTGLFNSDPVNYLDLWGLDATEILAGVGLILGGVGVVVVTVVEDIATLGAGVADDIPTLALSGTLITAGVNLISEGLEEEDPPSPILSAPVRDQEGNPIPVGNQPQSPQGKGANGGPMDIGDPGDLGGPNFKLPDDPSTIVKVGIVAAGVAAIYNEFMEQTEPLRQDISQNENVSKKGQ